MNNTSLKEEIAFKRISAIVKYLIANNSVYQERLKQDEFKRKISKERENLIYQNEKGIPFKNTFELRESQNENKNLTNKVFTRGGRVYKKLIKKPDINSD